VPVQNGITARNTNRAAELDRLGVAHVPCKTCSYPTGKTRTRLCDACWEVEHRLAAYLRDGGQEAISFVIRALGDATLDAAKGV